VPNALVATALALAVIFGAWFAFHPTVNEKEGPLVPTKNGGVERKHVTRTFVDANGKAVILVLLFPIACCGYALAMRTTVAAAAAGAAIVAFSLITTLFFWTDAAYYLICAVLMLIPAALVEMGVVEGEPV
jgi:peptidoglycan/LPS O-acetylase OafA/YrhL